MNPKKLTFKSMKRSFVVEAIPDNTGVRILETVNGRTACVGLIVDNDEDFLYASRYQSGMLIQSFITTEPLLLKDGSEPPLEYENQIEVYTTYGKRMVVRPLKRQPPSHGVIVAYEEDNCLWYLATWSAFRDELSVRLSE